MRNTLKDLRYLSIAMLLAGMALPAWASDKPMECTTNGSGNWTITVTGPHFVACPDAGQCTTLRYTIVPTLGLQPERIAIIAEHDVDVVVPKPKYVRGVCDGDHDTDLAENDCSSKVVIVQPDITTGEYELVVRGEKGLSSSSVAILNGSTVEACRIASLGVDFVDEPDPNAQRTENQTISFKGCTVNIPTNAETGEGGVATITGDNCVFVANAEPVSAGELVVNGQSVGNLTFGEGAISSGIASCTSKLVRRKLYTWCTCDDIDGDGRPEDPSPPCPATVP